MADQGLERVLRATLRRDAADAPAQHPQQSAACPGLARMVQGLVAGFEPDELEHLRDCGFCQKVLEMAWRADCPSALELTRHLAGRSAFSASIAAHAERATCPRCSLLLQSRMLQSLASAWRATSALPTRLADLQPQLVRLPAAIGATAPVTTAPFQHRAEDAATGVTITLRETGAGDLVLGLEVDDPALAGRRFEVELAGAEGRPPVTMTLHQQADGCCMARENLGRFAALAAELGPTCAVLLRPL